MGKMMDAAFIDRDDPKAAVEGLKKVEELARKGLSILIAPEGTRLDTTEVGPFKKGPFRIAMSAGIPIVPIVIRNAEVIAARDSSTFNPGTVDVVVYPPIPVDDWTVDNLSERIAEVRQLYLDTLKDWPHDELPDARAVHARQEGAGEEGRRPRSAGQEGPAKKAAAKKTAAKKTPAKKAAAKKTRRKRPPRRDGRESRRRPTSTAFATTDDALVLASVSSPAERELLNDWLEQPAPRASRLQRRRCCELPGEDDPPPGVLARLVEELEADEDRSVVPVRVFWVPGGLPTRSKVVGAAVGPRHLPPAGDSCSAASCKQGPVARPGGGRRTREGVRAAPAVERHHRRRKPQGLRAFRHPPRQPGDRTRRAAAARAGVQVAAADQARDAGVGAVPRGPGADSRRDRREGRRDARRTLHRVEPVLRRPDPVDWAGRSSAAASTRTSTTTAPRSSRCGTRWRPIPRCCCSRTGPTSTV